MLNHSNVVFYEDTHTYVTPEGEELSGVTSLLNRQMFARKYAGIPQQVLTQAASRGSKVHKDIEFLDSIGGTPDTDETRWYASIKADMGLVPLANEYLVSDGEYIASSIDIVYDDLTLADIKTTSKLDMDYLSWQLSIYAWLFERQNPGLKAKRLLAIWLPKPQYGKPCAMTVQRVPDEEVEALIEADKRGDLYDPKFTSHGADLPEELLDELYALLTQIKCSEQRVRQIKERLMGAMRDCPKFSDERLLISYSAPTVRPRFDSARLMADHPELCDSYITESKSKESLTIKLR